MKYTVLHSGLGKGIALMIIAISFQYCKPSQQTTATTAPVVTVFYEKDIKPIMLASCTPCHFPDQGRKKMLDTYVTTKDNIVEIIKRLELPVADEDFMPFKSKRPPLTATQVQLFKDWVKQGMAN